MGERGEGWGEVVNRVTRSDGREGGGVGRGGEQGNQERW